MSRRDGFVQYQGDGTDIDGQPVSTPGEQGRYIAHPDLVAAVNTALAVEQPLLVTGEAGTGKTVLAHSIAAELKLGEVEFFAVRSDGQGRDLLYEFDNLARFYDAQVQDDRARDRKNYLRYGALGRSFQSKERRVVLIDEIDKAPRDFPNDLLHVLDRMELRVPELDLRVTAEHRPVVVITSNREAQLPDPFLRRCVFHHISFPDADLLHKIVEERLGHLKVRDKLRERIVDRFLAIREVEGLEKRPSTGELLTWARVLVRADIREADLHDELADLPFLGALIKTGEDGARLRRRGQD